MKQLFDAIKFYIDHKIPFITHGHKHCVRGWVQTHCPFCGDKSYALGFHIASGVYNCWKCKTHSRTEVVKKLLRLDWDKAKELVKKYTSKSISKYILEDAGRVQVPLKAVCSYPSDCHEMNDRHKAYLDSRKFDPDKLERMWNLKGTGPNGRYKHRIIAPIYYNGVMVSYQGRDITGKSDLKYKACQKEDEVVEHQTVLYGIDHVTDKAVIVEGITDTWRLGYGAVCAFGMAFTMAQVNLLCGRISRAFILFDAEEKATELAEDLGMLLSARGVDVEILELDEGDPGEMKQSDANHLMKEVGLR